MNMLHLLDNGPLVGFYVLGFVAIFACLRVVMLANPVHAILSMIVSLISLAGIFFILGAPFAGALQIIVYAGAILVLFVFVIMMLNLGMANDERESDWLSGEVWAVPTGLTIIIAVVMYALLGSGASLGDAHQVAGNVVDNINTTPMMGQQTVTPQAVGVALFTEYLLLVEVAALLLLAALVAAYHLGKRALDDENVSHDSQKPVAFREDVDYKILDNKLVVDDPVRDYESSLETSADTRYEYMPVDAKSFQNKERT